MLTLKVFKSYRFGGDKISIFAEDIEGRRIAVGEPLIFKTLDSNDLWAENYQPTLTLEKTATQKLMDDLWDCGFRPSEGTGSAGCLAATQRHLSDIRKIAFDRLKINID